jgi:hypothetical protein
MGGGSIFWAGFVLSQEGEDSFGDNVTLLVRLGMPTLDFGVVVFVTMYSWTGDEETRSSLFLL